MKISKIASYKTKIFNDRDITQKWRPNYVLLGEEERPRAMDDAWAEDASHLRGIRETDTPRSSLLFVFWVACAVSVARTRLGFRKIS